MFRLLCLAPVICFPLAGHALELEQVVVTGDAQARTDTAQPVLMLDPEALEQARQQTLGEALSNLPGVSNASFGPGVGRPMIRGQGASRVKLLVNGQDSSDVSAMSADHAPMTDLAAADNVEVIQGPAALRYGGGAIGGVVKVENGRIAQSASPQQSLRLNSRLSSGDQGRDAAARFNAGNEQWQLQLDGMRRRHDDYHAGERVENSDTDSHELGAGLTYFWAPGRYIGVSLAETRYDYGVPNEDDEPARVRPLQQDYQLQAGGWLNSNWLSEWQWQLSHQDYRHDEVNGSEIEGLFLKRSWQSQIEVGHQPLLGWEGHIGVQFSQQALELCHDHSGCRGIPDYGNEPWDGRQGDDFFSRYGLDFGHSTPMPTTVKRDIALYWVAQRPWQHGQFELGLRQEQRRIDADEDPIAPGYRRERDYYQQREFNPHALSAAATWRLTPQQRVAITLARSQRAPDAEEMLWNGDHHATFSFQLDNGELEVETAHSLDFNWLYHSDRQQLRLALYWYEYQDYIYNRRLSVEDPFHGNAVYRHVQEDARFRGFEASWQGQLNSTLQLHASADGVRAQLRSGNNLPRIPPATVRFGLKWQPANWQLSSELEHTFAQRHVAVAEDESDGFTQLNLHIGQQFGDFNYRFGVKNLTDSRGELHSSYLKEFAPLPGRQWSLALQLEL
ncbi:TonB-dependent receptor [Bacterioplanes sanyensis]|uniref:TonB-dependent receptor n=1 Tax=Bacterioplanes sanyensis TaxID=1249553 RepID=UPI001673A7DF|nr:TonB-dependent receptor [Bacterioplanes sanyensis]GGY35895.1 TonB-dependent receptor [Bacterioplanes sanyensis]